MTEQAEPEETEDSVVDPEFKAAMDSYEEFFDEYTMNCVPKRKQR